MNNSKEFISRANDFGKYFSPHYYVYKKYFEPSVLNVQRSWDFSQSAKNSSGDVFSVELGVVESKTLPNAICEYNGNKHLIFLYHTFPIVLLEFFYRLLSSKKFLGNVGNPNAGSKLNKKINAPLGFAIMNGEMQIKHLDNIYEYFAPNCEIRSGIAERLYHYSMTLIWEHEIAHAFLGHCQYVKNHLGIRNISEDLFNSNKSVLNNRSLAYLEIEADNSACLNTILLHLVRRIHTPFEVISIDEETILDYQLRIFAGIFLTTIYMISDVLDSGGDMKSPEYWSNHPSSVARALNFTIEPIVKVNQYFDKLYYYEIKEIIENATIKASSEVLNLSDEFGIFRPLRLLMKEDSLAKNLHKHFLNNEENSSLLADLEKYRYFH